MWVLISICGIICKFKGFAYAARRGEFSCSAPSMVCCWTYCWGFWLGLGLLASHQTSQHDAKNSFLLLTRKQPLKRSLRNVGGKILSELSGCPYWHNVGCEGTCPLRELVQREWHRKIFDPCFTPCCSGNSHQSCLGALNWLNVGCEATCPLMWMVTA